MNNDSLQAYIDFLLPIAISKCPTLQAAEDLVQETLLAALTYTAGGHAILQPEAWLRTVFNRKFYDMLRKTYKLPRLTVLEGNEMAGDTGDTDFVSDVIRREEAENVRKEVAFLYETYRTIIVRHYFYGESVKDISAALGIPQGTVKSRLSFGRQQLMKGMENMEHYTENSYMPQRLMVRNSGCCGIHEEPMSLTEDDPLAQNLLILAYEKPLTITELSKAIGVASAYVEPVVKKLVDGELMKQQADGKVYTDFIIYHAEDFGKYRQEQEAFAASHSDCFCQALQTAIEALKKTDFYSLRLERYMLIHTAENGLFGSLAGCRAPQVFPERPNGGWWIAFGTLYPYSYVSTETDPYTLAGQRCTRLERYLEAADLKLYNYETALYPYPKHADYGYATCQEVERDMLKLFYLIAHQIDPTAVDCSLHMIKGIPLLAERGFISLDNGTPTLRIPRLTHAQEKQFWDICTEASDAFGRGIKQPLLEYVKTHKKPIPPHLKSVPEQKRTMPYEPKPMMFVWEAIKKGLHPRDLGFACPETFVVFE